MLDTLKGALHLPKHSVEILCSWNGSSESEKEIKNESGYELCIAQRIPYHFASNINRLAQQASGKIIALINDDVLLDQGSLDNALKCLSKLPITTIIGGLLRTANGKLQHMGFAFDTDHTPYHILEGLIDADNVEEQDPFEVPAVTAAVTLIPRHTFLQLNLNENYERCGEDVELNLDLRQNLQGHVFLCPGLSGIHFESATRSEQGETGNTSEDLIKLRTRRQHFFEQSDADQLRIELAMAARERSYINDLVQNSLAGFVTITSGLDYWRRQAQTLQLENLRLKDLAERRRNF